ncbi:MAG: methyl-accepting chemotaxis protein [Candidatus Omnitrophota bacterium]|jgi:methyl-accepting chemotaxis protein
MVDNFKNKRRNYFIDKRFQSDFILKFCTLVITSSVISGLIIYLMSRSTLTTVFDNSRLTIKSTADFILPAVLLASAIVIVLIGLATVWVTIFTSHRIAGPLYRMTKDIEEVAGGNLKKRFSLRNHDELKRLAASFDKMTESLRESIASIKETVAQLDKKAPQELGPELEKLRRIVNKFII